MARIAIHNAAAAAVVAVGLSGCCGMGPESAAPPGYSTLPAPAQPAMAVQPNPVIIPVADPQCAWEQVVDVVDDYFRIEHEEPPRIVGNQAFEGTLTTVAEVSPTIFEPWRHDTVDPDQRLENTLQSMRRQAVVRVTPCPAEGGHRVEVLVFKYLENVTRPEKATAGTATFRYDSSLTRVVNPVTDELITKDWIRQGRDVSLEQAIIGDLMSRFGQAGRPVVMRGQSGGN
jgi:hypothetical protein